MPPHRSAGCAGEGPGASPGVPYGRSTAGCQANSGASAGDPAGAAGDSVAGLGDQVSGWGEQLSNFEIPGLGDIFGR